MQSPRTAPVPQTRRAFTLVELLIVIAIIGLLAAILYPVFDRARENARRASCVARLQQMGLGWTQYSQDYDERALPWATSMATDTNGLYLGLAFRWEILMEPYVKSTQLFTCPSIVRRSGNSLRYAYSYNRYAGSSGRPLGSIPLPAQTPIFLECEGDSGTPSFTIVSSSETADGVRLKTYGFGVGWESSNPYSRPYSTRHFDGSNYLFADGHVKWLRRPNGGTNTPARVGLDYDCDGVLGNAGGPSNSANVGID